VERTEGKKERPSRRIAGIAVLVEVFLDMGYLHRQRMRIDSKEGDKRKLNAR
jgi:hypothetical protein